VAPWEHKGRDVKVKDVPELHVVVAKRNEVEANGTLRQHYGIQGPTFSTQPTLVIQEMGEIEDQFKTKVGR
jgi:hypothetical protein